jgi:hypothetical protein
MGKVELIERRKKKHFCKEGFYSKVQNFEQEKA